MLFQSRIANGKHPVLDKLYEAGAILHIQTTVPEFFLLGAVPRYAVLAVAAKSRRSWSGPAGLRPKIGPAPLARRMAASEIDARARSNAVAH